MMPIVISTKGVRQDTEKLPVAMTDTSIEVGHKIRIIPAAHNLCAEVAVPNQLNANAIFPRTCNGHNGARYRCCQVFETHGPKPRSSEIAFFFFPTTRKLEYEEARNRVASPEDTEMKSAPSGAAVF